MCVVSMIMDHGRDEFWPKSAPYIAPWSDPLKRPGVYPTTPGSIPLPPIDATIDAQRLAEFLKLYEKAKEYDEKNHEPHCEDPEKIKVLDAVQKRLEELEQRVSTVEDKAVTVTDGALTQGIKEEPIALFGSSILASTYEIGGKTVQLGDIVRRAHTESGLSANDWNELSDLQRDGYLIAALHAMRDEAAKAEKQRLVDEGLGSIRWGEVFSAPVEVTVTDAPAGPVEVTVRGRLSDVDLRSNQGRAILRNLIGKAPS